MPVYEFECPDCGTFTLWRRMSESSTPAVCVACGGPAPRVLSATNMNRRALGSPKLPEPRLVQTKNDRPPPTPKPHQGHGRPWMVSH